MSDGNEDFFWPSFTDLMTTLFFIILVLYILTVALLKNSQFMMSQIVVAQEEQLRIIRTVEKNLEPLQRDSTTFIYDPVYKRYQLAFDVRFRINQKDITPSGIESFGNTIIQIDELGHKLESLVKDLRAQKLQDSTLANISYLMVVSGSASDLPGDNPRRNYIISYERALALHLYWKDNLGIDFDAPQYHDIIEFQIAGNGIGGVGRIPGVTLNEEKKNQRFLINIIPKIGDVTKDLE